MPEVAVWWSLTVGETVSAREVLLRAVADHLGQSTDEVELSRVCPTCASTEHGRPVLVFPRGPHPFLSLSRAPGVLAVAVSDAGPVGIDVEEVARTAFAGFADVALHPDEVATTPAERGRVWTRKEALLKAAGTGLHVDPRLVRVSSADEAPRVIETPPGLLSEAAWMQDLDLPPLFAGSLVTVCAERPRVRVRQVAAGASAGRATAARGRTRPRPSPTAS